MYRNSYADYLKGGNMMNFNDSCAWPAGSIGERRKVVSELPAGCGVQLMPLKEVLNQMVGDVTDAWNALGNVESPRVLRNILREISNYYVDPRVPENIQHMILDIKGSVRSLRHGDYTRSQLQSDLIQLTNALTYAYDVEIQNEQRQENIENYRSFFLFMAEHSEAFVDWMNEILEKESNQ